MEWKQKRMLGLAALGVIAGTSTAAVPKKATTKMCDNTTCWDPGPGYGYRCQFNIFAISCSTWETTTTYYCANIEC